MSTPKRPRNAVQPVEDTVVALPVTPVRRAEARAETPLRKSRVDEKQELQLNNKRLEYLLFCMREREVSNANIRGQLDALRENGKKDVTELRNLYEVQLQNNRNLVDNLSGEVAKLKDENTRLSRDLTATRNELKTELELRKDFESSLRDRANEIRDLSSNVLGLEDQLKSANHENKLLQQSLNHTTASLDEARKVADSVTKQLSEEQLLVKHLKADAAFHTKKFEEEIAHYKKELTELSKHKSLIEEELRKDFGIQLEDILHERRLQAEQEKADMSQELVGAFNEKMRVFILEAETIKNELKAVQNERNALQGEIGGWKTRLNNAETQAAALEKMNEKLQTQLDEQAADLQKQIATHEAKFNNLSELFTQKEQDFVALMDVKVLLAIEIKAYRQLLEREEHRLGYNKHAKSAAPAVIDETEKLLVVGLALDNTYIRMKNGSTDNISLKGWKLSSAKTLKEYNFPATSISPGQNFTIFVGSDSEKKAKSSAETSFAVGNVLAHGDTGIICDNLGRLISKFEFLG